MLASALLKVGTLHKFIFVDVSIRAFDAGRRWLEHNRFRIVIVAGKMQSSSEGTHMDVNGVGWIAAIIIGGFAGWLAEQFMKSEMGMFTNIILGIVGAIALNAILAFAGIGFTGWLAYLVIGFIGACLLIAVGRAVRR
jgi:uncharacterized membrane protein YeaQ/YmgE (transglycosylase-associated protein family)